MKKQSLLSLLMVLLILPLLHAQTTEILDANFEQALIDLSIDTDGEINGEVLTADIKTTMGLDVSNKGISNLSGIEDFEALETLNCSNNTLGFLDLSKNTALTSLDCSYNNISSLDLSKNTALTNVNCRSNTLTALNVKNGNNTALKKLDAQDNIDLQCIQADSDTSPYPDDWLIHDNITSYSTNCHYNETYIPDTNFEEALIALGLDSSTDGYVSTDNIDNLLVLDISGKSISDLSGIADFRSLRELNCSNNDLTVLDLSNQDYLESVNCATNPITALDFSQNKNLTSLECNNNQLTELSIKNNNNDKLETFDATGNPELYCIEVDESIVSNGAPDGWQIDGANYQAYCNTTIITDENFEAYLETHDINGNEVAIGSDDSMGNGIEDDGKVSTTQIENVRILNISDRGIIDISGIEHFTALEDLRCSNNNLSSFDVSSNVNLSVLDCSNNRLINLNVASNSELTDLNCSNNQLTNTLDLTNNDQLKYVSCASNQLTAIVLNNNPLLTSLNCSENELTNLDLLNGNGETLYPLLKTLICSNNQLIDLSLNKNELLSALDVSHNFLKVLDTPVNPELKSLTAASNQLMEIDLSQNTKLVSLDVSGNLISNLDLNINSSLTSVYCSDNQLSGLSIKNGNNNILELFNAQNNLDLYCIEVDNASEIGTFWVKDERATYKEVCEQVTFVPDDNFEQFLIDEGYDDFLDDFVLTAKIETITTLDLSSLGIESLTGIEDFINLETLIFADNALYNLDVTPLVSLNYLDCSNNNLHDLTLKNDTSTLTFLDAIGNSDLSCIKVDDVAAAQAESGWTIDSTAAYSLDCTAGKTYIPDDNFEQALIDLGYDAGSLDNYVVTNSINAIRELNINDNNILDLTGIAAFKDLEKLDVSSSFFIMDELTGEEIFVPSNKLTLLDIRENTKLKELYCNGNYLQELEVYNNTSLEVLNCGNNQLKELNVSQNNLLETLIINANYLTAIDISANGSLTHFNGNSNYFKNDILNLTSNFELDTLFVADNKLTSIDVSQNLQLKNFDCSNNLFETIALEENVALKELNCSLNLLSDLDLTNNTDLEVLECNTNKLTHINVTSNSNLRFLSAEDNQLSEINVSVNSKLDSLLVSFNKLTTLNVSQNSLLQDLKIDGNLLTALNINSNTALLGLSCKDNQLETLNTSNNTLLNNLSCDGNQLQNLEITTNLALLHLSVSRNQLDVINLENNIALTSLVCDDNALSELNLSSNVALTNVSCSNNEISELDLSLHPNLVSVNAFSNALEALIVRNGNNDILKTFNVSNNPDLMCIEVDDPAKAQQTEGWLKDETASYSENCHYNETYVPNDTFEQVLIDNYNISGTLDDYVKTDEINSITNLDISGEGIDDLTGLQDFTALEILDCSSNTLKSLNVTHNEALITLRATNIGLSNLLVSDTTAIEVLDISSNQFSEIDLSKFPDLKNFNCKENLFIDLDLSAHDSLTDLNCAYNDLVTLRVNNGNNSILTNFDATSNTSLTCIEVVDPAIAVQEADWKKDDTASYSEDCHYNETYLPDDGFEQALIDLGFDAEQDLDDYVPTGAIHGIPSLTINNKGITDLTGLDDFENLVSLNCSNNALTNMDIISSLSLETINCSSNQLTDFDFAANPSLIEVNIADNLFTDIDISSNSGLKKLTCSSNALTSLDITQNPNLELLFCASNQLVSVDANNGFNNILSDFDSRDNPDLRCILVDDIAAAESYTNWFKDASAAYKLECNDDDSDGVVDENDSCPTTPVGDPVDLFGCSFFNLPVDNFSVLTTAETCRSGNNGKINITAIETYNYQATLIGDGVNNTYNFTNTVEIRNVRSGTYELCLTVEGRNDYKQCYSVAIIEPENLVVQRTANPPGGRVAYEMSGASSYTIDFNGLVFKTTDNYISLLLEKGKNTVNITTEADCQGVFEETIFLSDDILLFPNPFENYLHVNLGDHQTGEIEINIYTTSGILVRSEKYQVQIGNIYIDTSSLVSGIYAIHLRKKDDQTTFKMLKK